MNTIHEQMKSIRNKINRAEAIEHNLDTARQDYADRYYLDCMDAADRVLQLDSGHPEAIDLKKKANCWKDWSKPRRLGGPRGIIATQSTTLIETEGVPSTLCSVRRSDAQDAKNGIRTIVILKWLFHLLVGVGLVYLAVAHFWVTLSFLLFVFIIKCVIAVEADSKEG